MKPPPGRKQVPGSSATIATPAVSRPEGFTPQMAIVNGDRTPTVFFFRYLSRLNSLIIDAFGDDLTLETNSVVNGLQTLLNLTAGTNITLTDAGDGTVTIDASTGSGTSGAWYQQIPVGTKNGVNTHFYLDYTPVSPGYAILMVNGVIQNPYTRYSLVGIALTMLLDAPKATDEFVIWYFPGVAVSAPSAATLYLETAYIPDAGATDIAAAYISLWDGNEFSGTTNVPYLAHGQLIATFTGWAKRTDSWALVPLGAYGQDGSTYAFDSTTVATLLNTLTINLFVWNSARTLDARVAHLQVYGAYLDVTVSGVTTRYYPGSALIIPKESASGGSITNTANSIGVPDLNYTSVDFADATSGLSGSFVPGMLQLGRWA